MSLRDLLYIVDHFVNSVFEALGEEGERVRRMEGTAGSLLLLGLVFFLCFLLAGGPYVMVYRPGLLAPADNPFGATFVRTDPLEQGAIEGLIVGILYMLGIGGLYWLYISSRSGRPSQIVAMIAILCIAVATVLLYLISSWKI